MHMAPVNDDVVHDDLLAEDFARYDKKSRFFAALATEVAQRGYGDTSVEAVLRRAGMSRRTFYELFANLQDCFLQAYDDAARRARIVVGAAYHAADHLPLRDRVERALAAFLEACAAEPELARMCIVEALAAGPEARVRRDAAVLEFAKFIEYPRAEARGDDAPSLVSEAIAGGLYGILYTRIARGETEQLPGLLDELMDAGLGQLVERQDGFD